MSDSKEGQQTLDAPRHGPVRPLPIPSKVHGRYQATVNFPLAISAGLSRAHASFPSAVLPSAPVLIAVVQDRSAGSNDLDPIKLFGNPSEGYHLRARAAIRSGNCFGQRHLPVTSAG